MTLGSMLSWIICGLFIGMCARLLVPGKQNMSLPITTLLGIVGALAGGFIYSFSLGASTEPFSFTSHNWYGWIVAILGATFLLWIYSYIYFKGWPR